MGQLTLQDKAYYVRKKRFLMQNTILAIIFSKTLDLFSNFNFDILKT